MQESSKIIILKLNNFMHRHSNSSLIMLPSNSHLDKSAVGLCFCSVMQRHTSPILHRCTRAFPCSRDPAVHVGAGLLLAGSRTGLFPPSANVSNCMRQRRGERLIQVVCAKASLRDSHGQARLCSEQKGQARLCVDLGLVSLSTAVFGRSLMSLPHFPVCQELPWAKALWDPYPRAYSLPSHWLTCCRDWGGDSQGQSSCLSLWCPLCQCLSLISLLLTQRLAGGKLCRIPVLFGSLSQGVYFAQSHYCWSAFVLCHRSCLIFMWISC